MKKILFILLLFLLSLMIISCTSKELEICNYDGICDKDEEMLGKCSDCIKNEINSNNIADSSIIEPGMSPEKDLEEEQSINEVKTAIKKDDFNGIHSSSNSGSDWVGACVKKYTGMESSKGGYISYDTAFSGCSKMYKLYYG